MDNIPVTIENDKREIDSVWWDNADDAHIKVGKGGITKIVAYGEPSMHCNIAWIAIYRGDIISHRFPASQVGIIYKTETTKTP